MVKNLQQIENMPILANLILTLLEKLGFKEIVIKDDNGIISCVEESILGKKNYKVLYLRSELNGKVPYVLDLLRRNYENSDNIILITSNKKISTYFKDWILEELSTDKIDFWNEVKIISIIDSHYKEYWNHNDSILKALEENFVKSSLKIGNLQNLIPFDDNISKMLNTFIEPKIFSENILEDGQRQGKKRYSIDKIAIDSNYIIDGDAGTGKSTILREIGKIIITNNNNFGAKYEPQVPIIITTTNLQISDYSLKKYLEKYFEPIIGTSDIDTVLNSYKVLLLIDSVDEINNEYKEKIFSELNSLVEKGCRYIFATRNYENLVKDKEVCQHIKLKISNFDLHQVKNFLASFFSADLLKSENLWQSLKDHNILEKIPTTPLTLSLISILYEEKGYEIPATITDIYDNFNTFLLGRLNVNSRLEFLTINLKERILGLYALKVLKSSNRERLDKTTFYQFISNEFKKEGVVIDDTNTTDLHISLTDGTGVLFINENNFVDFQHDLFLEYYASREMFFDEKRIDYENEIIENFVEHNWQNVAMFYTGRTKKMSDFLNRLLLKLDTYEILPEFMLGASGLGYVLQSLWLTNIEDRKKGILKGLELIMKIDHSIKLLAQQNFPFFKGITENQIAMLNLAWFYNHYNSITLREALNLAFEDLYIEYKQNENTIFQSNKITLLYKMFCIGATLKIGNIGENTKLEKLFEEEKLLTLPLFVFLFDSSLTYIESDFKEEFTKYYKLDTKKRKYYQSLNYYLTNNASDLRNTTFEQLTVPKDVIIYTEGKTDASIIEHAFRVLTEGKEPYWNIYEINDHNSATAGGAQQVASVLKQTSGLDLSTQDKKITIIGLLDNDAKGYREFNGLTENIENVDSNRKRFIDTNIYLQLLPIPLDDFFSPYVQDKQEFKFFEVEHYFSTEYLTQLNMIKETSVKGMFEIIGDKDSFKNAVLKEYDPEIFIHFIALFNAIDNITKQECNYING